MAITDREKTAVAQENALWQRLVWMAVIWAAGVVVLGTVALLVRMMLGR